MRYYFYLQKLRIERTLIDFGMHPYAAILLMPIGFFSISFLLYYRTEWATEILVFLSAYAVLPLSSRKRNQFIKATFVKKEQRFIRVIENTIISTPFCLSIAYFDPDIALSIIPFLIAVIMALSSSLQLPTIVTPTPFYRRPHEFVIGFRKTWIGYFVVLVIAYISFSVHNYYLGMFCVLLISLLCMMYYDEIEHHFFVWNQNKNAQDFIHQKLKVGLTFGTILMSPLLIPIVFLYPDQLLLSFGLTALGYCYLLLGIVVKYCKYPSKYKLKEILLIIISLVMPPLLLLSIPYFYKHSLQSLEIYLYDKD